VKQAVLLVSHGTVDDLGDLAAFVTNVRRGHAPSADLVAELRRRYEAIGGRSPLNEINAEVARKLEGILGVRVRWANRLWRPEVRDVVRQLSQEGVTRVVLLPLAQYSAAVYAEHARNAALGLNVEVASVPNWGGVPELAEAFARRVTALLRNADLQRTSVVLTAHSLPQAVVDAGDPYERDVRAAADAVMARVRAAMGCEVGSMVAFQSQGMAASGRPTSWLGPTLDAALASCSARGDSGVVVAPIGFLADHVEILYDLDIEARAQAEHRGLSFARIPSLNADDDFLAVLALVAERHLSND
jgi:ferrochelatase